MHRLWLRLVRRTARPRYREGGFSLVEVVVAIGIFGIIASFVAASLATGLRGALLGKRREVATQEASRLLEVARSISYNELGLVQADPTIPTDSAITTQSDVKVYQVKASPVTYEPIVFATSTTNNPFNPHTATFQRGSTTLTRYVYITGRDENGDGVVDLKRISVRVTWDSSGSQGPANEVRAQTYIHGSDVPPCPPGACQLTPLKADTSSQPLSATVLSAVGTLTPPVPAAPNESVVFKQPVSTGDTSFRAVSTANCTGTTALLQSPVLTYGGHPVSSSADDDSQTDTASNPDDGTYDGVPPDTVSGNDEVDRLLAESSLSSTATCHTSAEDQDGVDPADDGLPYERGTGTGPSAITANEDISATGLGSTLRVLETSAAGAAQDIDQTVVADVREIAASASGSVGLTRLMVIPGTMSEGLVRIDPFTYSASVRSASGTPSQAPSVSADIITVWIFDPDSTLGPTCDSRNGSYCKVNLNPLAPDWEGIDIPALDSPLEGLLDLGATDISYKISVHADPPATDPVEGITGANGEQRWSAEYVALSVSTEISITVDVPIVGPVTLVDSSADVTVANVATHACAGVAC